MKNLKGRLLLLLLLAATLNIACEHCDDEDLIREEQEKTSSVSADTLAVASDDSFK